ncbi:HD domain-containing phosphohydrolase [Vibrio salinus]|uniref:HD domain-containing phosphohydrolase n=1 Tax=Vibrio salinus TaxID=2899784 RepID=UPI001E407468|nr:HD domain-containing phosphohydrolase [Vibrio salinus]MCE0495342.1 HD domain-containing protein [Vibrio salinus]
MKIRRYSLSIHIGTLFVLLTAIFGFILIYISYNHAYQLLTQTARELSLENSRHIENQFKQASSPIFTTLDLLSYSSLVNDKIPPEKNETWLASSHFIFQKHPHLVALYYANNDGDFTILRPMKNNQDRERFQAPGNTVLLINKTKTNGQNTFIYLDNHYQEISRLEKNDNKFDPTTRPWFQNTEYDSDIRITDPYSFYFLKTKGITLFRRTPDGTHVVAADLTLSSVSESLINLGYSEKTKLILFDQNFHLLGQHNANVSISDSDEKNLNRLTSSVFKPILNRTSSQIIYESVEYKGEEWSVTSTPVMLNNQVNLILAEAIPKKDLLKTLLELRNKQIIVTIGLLLMGFIIALVVARKISSPLRKLATLSENITRFDFKKTYYPQSIIREVSDLSHSLQLMEHTLHDLLNLLRKTAENSDFNELAKTITRQSYLVTKAETIIIYVYDNQKKEFVTAANHAIIPFKVDINQFINTPWLKSELLKGETVHINKNDNIIKKFHKNLYNSDIYLFPLIDKQKQLVGILNLGYERAITSEQSDKHAFLQELLSFAQLAKEKIDQVQQHKDLMNAFIELIASAIDTKSPYTGNHCQRVPSLSKWIAQAANEDNHYYPKFRMTDEQWEELKLSSWLHDCGKITTPEFVIDKATKLETIYDRIHEIRMRFEVIKREREIDYWKALNNGGEPTQLKQQLEDQHTQLDDDFKFIAACNTGQDHMSEDNVVRLNKISQYTWTRTLSNQIGISHTEKLRHLEDQQLPVKEPLISDKPEHIIHWEDGRKPQDMWQEQFTLQAGDVLFNRGEMYNLSVTSGTLTKEERFIINDHIVQTISMLKKLPYPAHLKNIPDIAGSHHERMDGRGYPRSLSENELSIQARSIAIADVFEALTSKDRPYKKAKSLSEAIGIMTFMATSGHLDPKLYLLFLEKKIYQKYAVKYLEDEQIDWVDQAGHIRETKAYIKKKTHHDSKHV